jgi:hypothetical protein
MQKFRLCGFLAALGRDDFCERRLKSRGTFIGTERPGGRHEPLGLLFVSVFSAFSFW